VYPTPNDLAVCEVMR